jgi:hypothetical protein
LNLKRRRLYNHANMDAMLAKAPVDPETVADDVEHLSISPFGPARASITEHPLSSDEVRKMTDYFHAILSPWIMSSGDCWDIGVRMRDRASHISVRNFPCTN